jgi:hypothetical protein
MADSTITFIVLGALVVLFVTNRVPVATQPGSPPGRASN